MQQQQVPRPRTGRWLLVATAAAAFTATGYAPATAAGSTSVGSTDAPVSWSLQHELSTRAANGLDTTTDHVLSVDSTYRSRATQLGIPLSPAEEQVMAFRSRLGPQLTALAARLESFSPSTFGGARLDPKTGGFVIAATDGGHVVNSLVAAAAATAGVPYTTTTVQHPLSELQQVAAAVQHSDWNANGIFSVDVDEIANQVVVGVPTAASSDGVPAKPSSSTVAALTSLFGPSVHVVGETISLDVGRTDTSGRVYGGQAITNTAINGTCTAGIGARGNNGSYYVITAGHCGSRTQGFVHSNSTAGPSIGTVQVQAESQNPGGTTCECEAVGPISSNLVSGDVLVSGNALFAYSRTATDGDYSVGRSICTSGVQYALDHGNNIACSHINSTGFATSVEGVQVGGLITQDTAQQEGGDSGGSVGDGSTFMGLHVGRATTSDGVYRDFFTRSSRIAGALGSNNITPIYPGY